MSSKSKITLTTIITELRQFMKIKCIFCSTSYNKYSYYFSKERSWLCGWLGFITRLVNRYVTTMLARGCGLFYPPQTPHAYDITRKRSFVFRSIFVQWQYRDWKTDWAVDKIKKKIQNNVEIFVLRKCLDIVSLYVFTNSVEPRFRNVFSKCL